MSCQARVFGVFFKSGSSKTSGGGRSKTGSTVGICFLRQWPLCPDCPPGRLPVFSLLFGIFLRPACMEDGMDEFSKSRWSWAVSFLFFRVLPPTALPRHSIPSASFPDCGNVQVSYFLPPFWYIVRLIWILPPALKGNGCGIEVLIPIQNPCV